MPGRMIRENQLPTPSPEGFGSKHTPNGSLSRAKHAKGSSSSGSIHKRLVSSSSNASIGQAKRTAYGSGLGSTNGLKGIDVNDDLFIRLLAQRASTESQDSHILSPEEIEELKNVSHFLFQSNGRNNPC
jgi:hypothetical protein